MPLEYIAKIAAVVACLMIVAVHVMLISKPKYLRIKENYDHKCVACAYVLFTWHYLYEILPRVA